MKPNTVAPTEMEHPKPAKMLATDTDSSDGGSSRISAYKGNSPNPASDGNQTILQRCGSCISGTVHNAFHGLGAFVARRPWITIFACVLLTMACGAGMTMFYTENRGEELWVPSGTSAQTDKDYVEQYYSGSNTRLEQFMLSEASRGDVLQPAAFDAAYAIHKRVLKVEALNPKDNVTMLTWDNYCLKRGENCLNWNVLSLFGYDETTWQTNEDILNRLNSIVPPSVPVDSDDEECSTSDGGFEITQMLGGITYSADGKITGAKLLSFGYLLQNNLELTSENAEVDPRAEAWEAGYLITMEDASASLASPWSLAYFSTRSFADEFGAEISSDITLLFAAIMLVIIYAIINLSRWSEGCSGFRGLLCMGGVLSIGMAIICSFGVCSALGLFYSPLMSVLPFLMLGIGVDDMFVIVNAYDNTPSNMPIPNRIALALAESGASVTVTSMTDILAFFIGSFTSLPALRNFSIFAAFGILFDYIFQVTFFVAFLVFDSRRRAAKAPDCLCCCMAPAVSCRCCTCCVSGPHDTGHFPYTDGVEPTACCCGPNGFFATDNKMRRLLGAIGRFLQKPVAKGVVLVLFAGVVGMAAYGASQIQVQGDVADFIPPGSYLEDFVSIGNEYLDEVGSSVNVYIEPGQDLYNKDMLDSMHQLSQKLVDDPWVSDCSVSELPMHLLGLFNSTSNSQQFHQALKDWLNGPVGARYINDLYWDTELSVFNLRLAANFEFMENSKEQVKAMDSIRETVDAHGTIGSATFAYAEDFLTWEGYKSIGVEAMRNIGFAMLMVFVVIMILLVHPLGALITFGNICLIVVEIIGFLYFWGLTIDNVTVIFIVISLGLSVDYSVHITHAFLHTMGSGNDRMVQCLEEMGVAVMNGVVSTWIAVMVLGGSGSYVFATFFKALFLCTTMGMLHGVVLLPVVLSLVNPGTVHNTKVEDEDEEMRLVGNNQ